MTKPTFGVDRDPGVVFGHGPGSVPLSKRPNPMVVAYGPYRGPKERHAIGVKLRDVTCAGCRFLVVKHDHGNRRYFGCEQRGPFTSGPKTDHLSGWPACALFESRL